MLATSPGPAMARPGDVDHREVVGFDDAVQMHIDEVEARRRAPMAEQARLDVLELERLFQERIVEQVDLADGEIVRRPPPAIDEVEFRVA